MTADQLIAAGPVKADDNIDRMLAGSIDTHANATEPQEVEKTKVTSTEPPKVDTSKIKEDGSIEDPLAKLKSIVTEKKQDEPSKKSEDAKTEGKSTGEDSEGSRDKSEDIPPTARFPKKPLEEQLKEEDLKDIDPAALEYFKRMDKSAREYVKARLKENSELKAKLAQSPNSLPSNWFDHEEAYILHPEFKKNIGLATRASQETEYWKEQLRKVRKGEKWHDLDVNAKGEYVRTEMEPDVNAEDELQSRIREGERLSRDFNNAAIAIKTSFETQRNGSIQAIKAIENKFFPQYAEDKDHANHKYVKAIQETLGKFGQTNNILSGFITNLYRFALEMCDENSKLEKQISSKKELQEERVKAGPTSEEVQGGKGKSLSGEDKPFDIAEFMKYKA